MMVQKVWTCRPSDPLSMAAGLMWEHDIGCVPVVDDDGRPVAMLTDRDIAMSSHLSGRPPTETTAMEAMSKRLATIKADQRADEAEAMMRANRVRRLPVVDAAGELVGIISLADIARALPRTGVDGVEQTLNALSQPWAQVAESGPSTLI
jgi:CBS domain-containing protein